MLPSRLLLGLLVACRSPSVLDGTVDQSATRALLCQAPIPYTTTPPLTGTTTSPLRPTHTFSIVARDPATGDLGVAVQSHWFNVGAIVMWAEPGVGAVATQSFAEPAYGPKGLALMRDGVSAPDALQRLIAADKLHATRQLGFVDAKGEVASYTGARNIKHASSHVGQGYAVQANLMANELVVPAMRHAYEAAKGDLAERLLVALEAAQEVGGDIRGCQSAAILIVSGKRAAHAAEGRMLDLRIEDHPAPLVELRRLITRARAYDQMNRGDAMLEAGNIEGANAAYSTAAKLEPDHPEMAYWHGITWASRGELDKAGPFLKKAFQADPRWIELVRRMPAAGLLPDEASAEKAIAAGTR